MKAFFKSSLLLIIAFISLKSYSQTTYEAVSPGSYVIDMGVFPQTAGNALSPYGMVWELVAEQKVPILWIINPNKTKDGIDFSYNGNDYRGGPFIIEAEYRNPAVDAVITYWEGLGVQGITTSSSVVVPVARTIDYFINWTLDAQNGGIAEGYLLTAGLPERAYNWVGPQDLNCCNDIFVMPHADPEWETHSNLWFWNRDAADGGCNGAIWAACHAVSALEDMFNPLDPTQQTNFLSEKSRIPLPPGSNDPWDENALVLWKNHGGGTQPYTYNFPAHPVMQFLGTMDGALESGSENLYLPVVDWRPTTIEGVMDFDNPQVPGLSPGPAGKVVFGPGLGDPTRGKVMYEAGHKHSGTDPDAIAAQRAFFNYSFWSVADKSIKVTSNVPVYMAVGGPSAVSASAIGGSGDFNYEWSADCAGTFGNPFSANTTFTPAVDGPCVVSVTVTDVCGRTSFSRIPVTVVTGPLPPNATNDAFSVAACGNGSMNVLTNDLDPNADPLTVTLIGSGLNGNFTNNGNGIVSYAPAGTFTGTDSIQYQVCDPGNLCDFAWVVVTVVANTAPIAVNDTVDLNVDQTSMITYLVNDSDPENGALTTTILTAPVNGTASIIGNQIQYTPDYNFAGADSIQYRICDDGCTPLCDTAWIYISVSCPATPGVNCILGTVFYDPDGNDTLDAGESGAAGITVRLYADDSPLDGVPDGAALDSTVTGPGGVYQIDTAIVYEQNFVYQRRVTANSDDAREKTNGDMELNNGSLKITKTGNDTWHGFRFTNLTIPAGATIDSAFVRFTADGDKPNTTASLRFYGQDNTATPLTFNTTSNNLTGRTRTSATVDWTNLPSWSNNAVYKSPDLKTIMNEIYTAVGSYSSGSITIITESIGDNAERKAFAHDGDTTKAPELLIYYSVPPLGPSNFLVDVNESTLPPGGSLTSAQYQASTFSTSGTADCSNNFGYDLSNLTPLAVDDLDTTEQEIPLQIDVISNDSDPEGDNLILSTVSSQPTSGGSAAVFDNGTPGDPSDDLVVYSPPGGFTGIDTFEYIVCDDGSPSLCDTAEVLVVVTPYTNDPPVAIDDVATTEEGESVTIDVLDNDSDPEGDLITPPVGTGTLPAVTDGATSEGGTVSVDAAGDIIYTPASGYTGLDTFYYVICDPSSACDTAEVVVTVTPQVNNRPIARDDTGVSACSQPSGGVPEIINVIFNDNDSDGTIDTSTVTLFGPAPGLGSLVNNGNGTFTFTANPLTVGSTSFQYVVADDDGAYDTATVFINIVDSNPNGPVANDDAEDVPINQVYYVAVLDNDSDADGHDLSVSLDPAALPANGTVNVEPNGQILYTPNSNYVGVDSFDYILCDDGCLPRCDTARVRMTVINQPPVATDDNASTGLNTAVTIDVMVNDIDLDLGTINLNMILTDATSVSGGTITLDDGGTPGDPTDDQLIYNPLPGFTGLDTFQYYICDDASIPVCDSALVYISVTGPIDLELTKVVDDPNQSVGNNVVFTLTVTNNSASTTATGVFVKDNLPSGLAYVSDNSGGLYDPVSGVWYVNTVASGGGTASIQITATILNTCDVTNVTEITTADQFDIDSSPNNDDGDQSEDDEAAVAAVNADSDGDLIADYLEGCGDRDSDGIPNFDDFDPTGYFYDETSGEILTGGSVSVSGPGAVNLVLDGSSGSYQWTVSVAGTYTMVVTPPPGYVASPSCLPQDPPAYDPTGNPDPDNLGASEQGSTGFLNDASCSAFYLTFDLEAGDPFIINNNLPFALDTDGDGTANSSDTDGDGIANNTDIDDDNDGIPDIYEYGDTLFIQPQCGGAQTLDFSNAYSEETGDGDINTFLPGEVFRFPSVAPSIDAMVTIVATVNTTVPVLDDNSVNPTSFQPQSAFSLTSAGDRAYTEYNFQFVQASTLIPVTLDSFFVFFSDVDGNTSYSEQDWTKTAYDYTINNPTELTITEENGWLIGTGDTTEYPSVTDSFPQVNYSTLQRGLSDYTIRLGALARMDGVSASGRQHKVAFECIQNFTAPITINFDYDGDGIPNSLDLDSDNDGCPDANEAGHGETVQTDSTIAGPYGTNGLDDAVETPADSDNINYTITETNPGTFDFLDSLTVSGCNTPPIAIDDVDTTVENTPIGVDVLDLGIADSDLESNILITAVGSIAGSGDGTTTQGGSVSINDNSTPADSTDDYIDYTPLNGYNGQDTFYYVITDAGGLMDTAQVIITVIGPCDAVATGNADADNDGLSDVCDLDDDNDGILDALECPQEATYNTSGEAWSHGFYHIYNTSGNTDGSGSADNGWEAAITGGTIVTVDDWTDGGTNPISFPNGTITLTTLSGQTGDLNVNAGDTWQTANDDDGIKIDPGSLSGNDDNEQQVDISFTNPVTSVSFDLIDLFDTNTAGNANAEIEVYVDGVLIWELINPTIGTGNTSTTTQLDGYGGSQGTVAIGQNLEHTIGVISDIPFSLVRIIIRVDKVADPHGRDALGFDFLKYIEVIDCPDTDNDGTADYLDTDSDGDGCADAIEGDSTFTIADIQNDTLTGGIDVNGIPIAANGGQGIGLSQDSTMQDENCPCTLPTIASSTITPVTCSGSTPNTDGSNTLRGILDGNRVGISSPNPGIYDGPDFSSATVLTADSIVFAGLSENTSYLVRIFNGNNTCFQDFSFAIPAAGCNTPPVAIDDAETVIQDATDSIYVLTIGTDDSDTEGNILITSAGSDSTSVNDLTSTQGGTLAINNNGTPADSTDDFIVYTPFAGYTGLDTFYYVITDAGGLTDTAQVIITVVGCIVDAGVVGTSDTLCGFVDPPAFTEITPASGNGTLSYQWIRSTTDCSSGFSNISGATSATYDAGTQTTTAYYRRVVTNTFGALTCSDTSNCITLVVNRITAFNPLVTNLRCEGSILSNGAIELRPGGGLGTLYFDWDNDGTGDFDDPENLTGLDTGTYTVVITDSICSSTWSFYVGDNQNPYASLILTGSQSGAPFPSSTYTGGYGHSFPITGDSYDMTFDHLYIPTGYIIDPEWAGTGTLNYVQNDALGTSNASHSTGDRVTEIQDFNSGSVPSISGDIYALYGRGINSFGGNSTGHDWTVTYDFSTLVNGYLPAGTFISVIDIDGSVSNGEEINLVANLVAGGSSPWLNVLEQTAPLPMHGLPVYEAGGQPANSYHWDGPDVPNNAGIAMVTTQDITSITLNALFNSTSGSYGIKFAAPIIPFEVLTAVTQPNCSTNSGTVTVTAPVGPVYQYSINGGSLQSSPVFAGLAEGDYAIYAVDTLSNCQGASDSVNINSICVDDDFATTNEDTPIAIDILSNDSILGNVLDTTSLSIVDSTDNGVIVINMDGTVTYTPDSNFNGMDTFTYTICDVSVPALCDTAEVVITVLPVNDAPDAGIDTIYVTLPEDSMIQICVTTATDIDSDDVDLSTVTDAPDNGGLSGLNDGDTCVTYTPTPDFFGQDTTVLQLCDDGTPILCDSVVIIITVTPVNDPPIANDDLATVNPWGFGLSDTVVTVPVTFNDSDPEGGPLTISLCGGPNQGVAVLIADSIQYYYTGPVAALPTVDTVCYVACDPGSPVLCDTALLIVQIPFTGLPPVATDDAATTDEDIPVVIDVQVNDYDPNGDSITTVFVTDPPNGTAVIVNNDSILYTPDPDFTGIDTFEYVVCDTTTPINLCDTAQVIVTVLPINDAPVGVPDTVYLTIPEDSMITHCFNVMDVDGDDVDVTASIDDPDFGINTGLNDGDTCFTYTPNPDYFGQDTTILEICDNGSPTLCDSVVVIITVTPVNDPPIAVDDTDTTNEDTPVVVDVITNDNDPDSGLDTSSISISDSTDNGILTVNGDGTVTYSPDPDFFGTDTFEYIICDLGDTTTGPSSAIPPVFVGTASQNVHTNGAGFDPVSNEFWYPQFITTNVHRYDITHNPLGIFDQGTSSTIQLWKDLSSADYYTANWSLQTVTRRSGNSAVWTYSTAPDNARAVTTDQYNAYVLSGNGSSITVLNKNTGAFVRSIALPDLLTNVQGTFVYANCQFYIGGYDTNSFTTIPVSNNAVHVFDHDGTYLSSFATIPFVQLGSAFDGENMWIGDGSGTIWGYQISNGNAYLPGPYCGVLCDEAQVVITVLPVNDPPIAEDTSVIMPEDSSIVICPVFTDLDGTNDSISVLDCGPSNGLASITANDSCITYTPTPDYFGQDTICYVVCDAGGLCDTAEIVITVTPVNDPPVAVDDIDTTDQNLNVTIDIIINDYDIDGDLDTASITILDSTNNGTLILNGDGTVTYDPDPSFIGIDTLEYAICDTGLPVLCDTAIVLIVVESCVTTAICQDITIQLDALGAATIVPADIDNGSNSLCGIASLSLDQTAFACADVGANTVTLTVTDNNSNTATCTANVQVEDNVDPTAICQDVTVQLNASGAASIVAGDIDNGSNDACGIASLSLDQSSFACADIGSNTVTLTVTDNNGNSSTCTANVTVELTFPPITAGADGTLSICSGDVVNATDLLNALTGEDAGGIWLEPFGGAGTYTYVVSSPSACIPNDTSEVIVSETGISSAGLDNVACNDNGTNRDPLDDFVTFDLDPSGINLAAGYTLTVNNGGSFVGGNTGTYGSPQGFQLQPGSADNTLYTITITDDGALGCVSVITVQSGPCSDCASAAGTITGVSNK